MKIIWLYIGYFWTHLTWFSNSIHKLDVSKDFWSWKYIIWIVNTDSSNNIATHTHENSFQTCKYIVHRIYLNWLLHFMYTKNCTRRRGDGSFIPSKSKTCDWILWILTSKTSIRTIHLYEMWSDPWELFLCLSPSHLVAMDSSNSSVDCTNESMKYTTWKEPIVIGWYMGKEKIIPLLLYSLWDSPETRWIHTSSAETFPQISWRLR